MTGNNKSPILKHKLTTADKERLHILLRMRMIACGRREQVNRLVRNARIDSKILSREQLKIKIAPQARAVVPVLIMGEIMREMELCHGPKIIDMRPRSERPHLSVGERLGREIRRNPHRIERNARLIIRNGRQIRDARQIRLYAPQIEGNYLRMEGNVEGNGAQAEGNAAQMEGNAQRVEGNAAQAEGNATQAERNTPQVEENALQAHATGNDSQIKLNGPQIAQVVQQIN